MVADVAVVGLGNPGAEYSRTRHNVGYRVVEELVRRHGVRLPRQRYQSWTARTTVAGRLVLLVKPLTYMNQSGVAVQAAADALGLRAEDVWVIVDDFQLPLGTLRIRPRGSDGGHGGLKSIIERLRTQEFPRIRLGIGLPKGSVSDVEHVLGEFAPDERETVERLVHRAADAVEVALADGPEVAMSRFNGSVV
jgi:PTH1 family peptidyl-tRNA hydrolase